MAPFKSKINSTFHRINDRLKRHRFNDDEASYPKQPRIFPSASMPFTQQPLAKHILSSLAPPGEPSSSPLPSFSPPAPQPSLNPLQPSGTAMEAPSPASSMSLEYTHLATATTGGGRADGSTGTLTNPIDLTHNSNQPSSKAPGRQEDPIDLTDPIPEGFWLSANQGSEKGKEMDLDHDIWEKVPPSQRRSHASRITDPAVSEHNADLSQSLCSFEDQVTKDEEFARILQHEEDSSGSLGSFNGGPFAGPSRSASASNSSSSFHGDATLPDFHMTIYKSVCSECSNRLNISVDDVVKRTRNTIRSRGLIHPYIPCRRCGTSACVGCSSRLGSSCEPQLPFGSSGPGFRLAWCCHPGRLFLIWSLCCGISMDKPAIAHPVNSIGKLFRGRLIPPIADKAAIIPGPKAFSKGIGYGVEYDVSNSPSLPAPPPDTKAENEELEPYFLGLAALLPSLSETRLLTSFDFGPPTVLTQILSRSPLLFKAMELLRNDSIDHVSDQWKLYNAVLSFIEALRDNPATAPFLLHELALYAPDEKLPHLFTKHIASLSPRTGSSGGSEKQRQTERGKAIVNVMKNLATQCDHFFRAAQTPANLSDFQGEDGKRLLALCQRICGLLSTLESIRNTTGAKGSGGLKDSASSILTRSRAMDKTAEELRDWHRNNSVADQPDEHITQDFHFRGHALLDIAQVPVKGRMKKMLTQVSVLRTSLPEGIFVRHCTSRLDIMRVIIIGPQGTPYENGIFEFDLWCAPPFPLAPPQMHFRTTGSGRVRFNPNLYEDGKVCLSLLGTWSGEPWDPNRSTLLQMLVSIQAMIFTSEPWYNEPGRERSPNKGESDRYNTLIQQYTMEHAMLYWLNTRLAQPSGSGKEQPTGDDDAVWGEVIRKHFTTHAKSIVETTKKWKGRKRNDGNHARLMTEIRDSMTRHGFL